MLGAGNGSEDDHAPRSVRPQASARKGQQVALGGLRARLQHHGADGQLVGHVMLQRQRNRLAHRRVQHHGLLNLGWIDVDAIDHHRGVRPTHVQQQTLRVDAAQVAGVEPAVLEEVGAGRVVVVIGLWHAFGTHADESHRIGWQHLTVCRHHLQLDARHRAPDRWRQAGHQIGRRHRHGAQLGAAKADQQMGAEALAQEPMQRRLGWARADAQAAHVGEPQLAWRLRCGQLIGLAGHARKVPDVVRIDAGDQGRQVAAAGRHDCGAARGQAGQVAPPRPVEGQRHRRHVALAWWVADAAGFALD